MTGSKLPGARNRQTSIEDGIWLSSFTPTCYLGPAPQDHLHFNRKQAEDFAWYWRTECYLEHFRQELFKEETSNTITRQKVCLLFHHYKRLKEGRWVLPRTTVSNKNTRGSCWGALKRYSYTSVHRSLFTITQVSICGHMAKQNWFTYTMDIFSLQKELWHKLQHGWTFRINTIGVHLQKEFRAAKIMKARSKMVVTRTWGGKDEGLLFYGSRFRSFGEFLLSWINWLFLSLYYVCASMCIWTCMLHNAWEKIREQLSGLCQKTLRVNSLLPLHWSQGTELRSSGWWQLCLPHQPQIQFCKKKNLEVDEWMECHCILYFKMVEIEKFSIYIFYHSKNLEKWKFVSYIVTSKRQSSLTTIIL